MGKTLIAYFSRPGQNYVNGSIKNLEVGNTKVMAEMISILTGGDLFEINPTKVYSIDYTTCTQEAQEEKRAKARPELRSVVEDMDNYDVIYLGYPNWWGTCPMAVFTFLESYDFAGKTIIPFCTHEGSGMGKSEGDIENSVNGAIVKKGLAVHGTDVNASQKTIERWVRQ